jgi:predicted  nucleic acid-binding Zn-ribbon protein
MPHHQAFVDYFVHEFMEELWYLQKVARGDIPARQDADPWQKFFNVTQGLLSLAPIPGLPLGFLLSKELIKKCVDYGEKALKLARKVNAEAKAAYDKSQEFLAKIEQLQQNYELTTSKPESKGMLQQEGPMDLIAIRVLVELVGRGLANRYEHVLSHYIDTSNPEKSYIPLARVMAKRLFEYLQSEPLLAEDTIGDWTAQSMHLLNGVILAKVDKSWREQITSKSSELLPRFLKDMHKVELPLQTEPKKQLGMLEKFTAEGVIKRSAWYDDKAIYARPKAKTEWWEAKGQPTQPKYGYTYISYSRILPKDNKPVSGDNYAAPPRASRYYQPVSVADIQAYLATPEIKAARAAKQTTSLSFHAYLQQQQGRPKHLQAVCHEDLTAIKDWSFANFHDVDFSGASLTGNLSGTQFGNAYLVGTVAKEVFCDKNHPANFSKAQLGFGDWRGARLPKADFTQADLSLINFSGADLTAIHTEGTVWYKADLTGITRQDLLAEQAKQVEASQAKLRNSLAQLEKQVEALEQRLEPELEKLHALEEQSEQTASTTQKLTEKMAELQTELAEKTAPLQQQITELQQQMAQREMPQPSGHHAALSKQIEQLQQQIIAQNAPLREQIAILQVQTKHANERMEMVTAEIITLQTTLHADLNKAFKTQCDQLLQRLDERMDNLDKNIAGVQKRVDEQAGGINKNIAGVQKSLDEHAGNLNQNIDHVLVAVQKQQPELFKFIKEVLAQELRSVKRMLIQFKPAEQKPAPQESASVQQPSIEPTPPTPVEKPRAFEPTQPDRSHNLNLSISSSHQTPTSVARTHSGIFSPPSSPPTPAFVNKPTEVKSPTSKVSFFQQNQQQALQDNPVAMYNLAEAYYHGDGVTQDHKAALQWYQKAADKGHAAARCELGIMLLKGKGTPKNVDRAFELFQSAAPTHGKATFMVGYCHQRGHGTPEDFKKALSYYQKAQTQGYAEAQQQYQAVAKHLGLISATPASPPSDQNNYVTPKQNFPSRGPSS